MSQANRKRNSFAVDFIRTGMPSLFASLKMSGLEAGFGRYSQISQKTNAAEASHLGRIVDRCPACLLSRLTRESVLRVGRVLEEHNLPCTLPIMILKIIDLQSWRRPAAQSCRGEDFLRRPQRPGIHYASNAFWETLRRFTLENHRKPLVCHNALAGRSEHLTLRMRTLCAKSEASARKN